jgi:hypothetical protein
MTRATFYSTRFYFAAKGCRKSRTGSAGRGRELRSDEIELLALAEARSMSQLAKERRERISSENVINIRLEKLHRIICDLQQELYRLKNPNRKTPVVKL